MLFLLELHPHPVGANHRTPKVVALRSGPSVITSPLGRVFEGTPATSWCCSFTRWRLLVPVAESPLAQQLSFPRFMGQVQSFLAGRIGWDRQRGFWGCSIIALESTPSWLEPTLDGFTGLNNSPFRSLGCAWHPKPSRRPTTCRSLSRTRRRSGEHQWLAS